MKFNEMFDHTDCHSDCKRRDPIEDIIREILVVEPEGRVNQHVAWENIQKAKTSHRNLRSIRGENLKILLLFCGLAWGYILTLD